MKTLFKTAIISLTLILAFAFVSCFTEGTVAYADMQNSFYLDYVDGEFVLSYQGQNIYQAEGYNTSAMVSAMKEAIGEEAYNDGNYNFEFVSPQIDISLSGDAKQTYSETVDTFSFGATAAHPFDDLGMIGYEKVDYNSNYQWKYAYEGSVETAFGGNSPSSSFGIKNACGKYVVYAYGTATLTVDGKKYYATGKSDGIEIEILQGSITLPDIDEDLLETSCTYGETLSQVVEKLNNLGDFMFALADESLSSVVYDVGTYGVEVVYHAGNWAGGAFVENTNLKPIKLPLAVRVDKCNVEILIYHGEIKEGSTHDPSKNYAVLKGLPKGFKVADLGISFRIEDKDGNVVDGGDVGQYTIKADWTNKKNFDVVFTNYENKDAQNKAFSTWATLTVNPVTLSVSDEKFTYTVSKYEGFKFGDRLIIEDSVVGGKTLKIYNGEEVVDRGEVDLTVQRKSGDILAISLYVDGEWKTVEFDEGGKITVKYVTGSSESFGIKEGVPAPEEKDNKEGVIIGVTVSVVAVIICVVILIVIMRRKKGDDGGAEKQEDAENSQEAEDKDADKAEMTEAESIGQNAQSVETAELTLEEKYALHPEFVPTPTVEEAFNGAETEDTADDEKDAEESMEEGKITFKSKILSASIENRAIYNALKNKLLSYRGIKCRVVNGGDYFRRPGKQIVKIIFIGKTIRLALALNPEDYDYNLYHQKDRGNMKKYADTPMFVKVQSLLGVRRAYKLIEDLMEKEGVKPNKKSKYDDYLYNLTYDTAEE